MQPHYPQPLPPQSPGHPAYAPGPYQPQWPAYPGQVGAQWQPVPGQGAPFYPGHNGYPYPGYMYQPYGYYNWQPVPVAPKRDPYTLVVSIIAFICSILVALGGIICLALTAIVAFVSSDALPSDVRFAGAVGLLTFALMGIIGGGFCIYHCIRALFLRKPSRNIWLPRFWFFIACYLVVLAIGFLLHSQNLDVAMPQLTTILIYLGALSPALAILALGLRRLRPSKTDPIPTSWRRFTLALVSGATLSVGLAIILELILELILVGSQSSAITACLNNSSTCTVSPSIAAVLLVMLAVVAPLVEEFVKPLAVVILIGRVLSKAEAFALGLACGIGFNLIETTGYISTGYTDWLNVTLERSGAGLLHGFGAAMMALGWYYLTHKEEGSGRRRVLLALGCGGYAILQHAVWNGSVGLAFLPGPIGQFFMNWSYNLGGIAIDASELVNIVEVIAILIFFVYMTGRLRQRPTQPSTGQSQPDVNFARRAEAMPG